MVVLVTVVFEDAKIMICSRTGLGQTMSFYCSIYGQTKLWEANQVEALNYTNHTELQE